MPRRAGLLFVLIFSTAASARSQPVTERSPFESGKAALDAHDPTAAITHFERADGKEARSWLAVALMMESRSPSDRYVERAFDAAARSRTDRPELLRSRSELAAAMRPGEMVIASLVGDKHSYAWAFDRDALIGYPLPPPEQIATAVQRINSYAAQRDGDGIRRVADEFVPSLLGPAVARLPSLTRVILVMDGPLRQLPIKSLFSDQRRLAVSIVDDESLLDEIRRTPPPPAQQSAWPTALLFAAAAVIAILVVALARRRRSSVA